jgi:hypothetical protein
MVVFKINLIKTNEVVVQRMVLQEKREYSLGIGGGKTNIAKASLDLN